MAKGAGKQASIIALLLLIITVLVVVLIKPGEKLEELSSPADTSSSPAAQTTETVDEPRTPSEPVLSFEYLLPEEWDGLERAEKNIQSLGEGQKIVPGIVQDPTDENIVYFASSIFDEENTESLVSVYRYNSTDYNFDRLYKNTFGIDSELKGDWLYNGKEYAPKLGAVGYENGKLILGIVPHQIPDNCGVFLELGPGPGAVSMDIKDPYSGLEEYILSEDIQLREDQLSDECIEYISNI